LGGPPRSLLSRSLSRSFIGRTSAGAEAASILVVRFSWSIADICAAMALRGASPSRTTRAAMRTERRVTVIAAVMSSHRRNRSWPSKSLMSRATARVSVCVDNVCPCRSSSPSAVLGLNLRLTVRMGRLSGVRDFPKTSSSRGPSSRSRSPAPGRGDLAATRSLGPPELVIGRAG